jgi:hypothetical protein
MSAVVALEEILHHALHLHFMPVVLSSDLLRQVLRWRIWRLRSYQYVTRLWVGSSFGLLVNWAISGGWLRRRIRRGVLIPINELDRPASKATLMPILTGTRLPAFSTQVAELIATTAS